MVCKDLLIGLPVKRHLRVDTMTLLEAGVHALDGADCSIFNALPNMSTLGRLVIGHLDRQSNDNTRPAAERLRVNNHKARLDEDPFPDPSLLNPIDEDQHDDICKAVEDTEKTAKQNGLANI